MKACIVKTDNDEWGIVVQVDLCAIDRTLAQLKTAGFLVNEYNSENGLICITPKNGDRSRPKRNIGDGGNMHSVYLRADEYKSFFRRRTLAGPGIVFGSGLSDFDIALLKSSGFKVYSQHHCDSFDGPWSTHVVYC